MSMNHPSHIQIGGDMVPFLPTLNFRWLLRRNFEGGEERVLQQEFQADGTTFTLPEIVKHWRDVPEVVG